MFSFLLMYSFVSAQEERVYIGKGMSTVMIKTSGYYEQASFYNSFWNMDSDFKYGVIYLVNGDSIDDIGIRYNITRDRFEVKVNNKEGIYILNPESVSHIKRMSDEFVFSKYYNKQEELAKGYFNVVYDGNTRLLYKKAEIHKAGKKGAFGYKPYKTFSTEYYIQKPGEEYPVWVKIKKKDILKMLDYNGPKLEVFADENHLRFSKISDLVKILSYYDQLSNNI